MRAVKRRSRVSGLIQAGVSELLLKKIKDPRLALVTITSVEVSNDLRVAHVYFCVRNRPEREEEVRAGLESAMGFVRREMGRYVPELSFHYDESFDYGDRIDRILSKLHETGSD
ncbi:MAG: 30S ribosome-binding factor RbfA [Desulfobacterales bacterium]|jgi:ribosome-binding factor A|nr:30S ribosome-binding factor RbfA [Desulfobacterales bacterium]